VDRFARVSTTFGDNASTATLLATHVVRFQSKRDKTEVPL
jgi:hypothetical protein